MKALFIVGLLFGSLAFAEDKTCGIKGMHCEACAETVHDKVCKDGAYTTCDAKVVSEEKERGEVHLVTKDKTAKIDQKKLAAAVKDAGYEFDSCKDTKATGKEKPASKKKTKS